MSAIYRLMATYWDRYDALSGAMDASDDTDPHTPEREAADQAQSLAGDALDDAAVAICAFIPEMAYEARIKADFLAFLIRENGGSMDRNWAGALVGSLSGLTLHKARASS